MCVVSHEDLGETDFPYILVESTGQALLDIAKLYRDSFDMKVVGITGSRPVVIQIYPQSDRRSSHD